MNPYVPEVLPLQKLDYQRLFGLVGQANAALARYDGSMRALPNPEIMLSPLTLREAELSSRIEGTQATLSEVLEHEAGAIKSGEKEKDIQEIINYRTALSVASDYLREGRHISLHMVRELHRLLLDSVRGRDKTPGMFRTDQNWIGRPGCAMDQASYVPPSPLILEEHLRTWEEYLSFRDIDPLVQTAVMHAQFELIHPFRDGNGRIGRLLIPLFLYQLGLLWQPMFYLSEYLDHNRDQYYDRLNSISSSEDWDGWIAFFLDAIIEQSTANTNAVLRIKSLYDEVKRRVDKLTRSSHAIRVIDALFDRPLFSVSDFGRRAEINRQTANLLLDKFKADGMVRQVQPARGRRSEILVFPALLNIVA